MKSFRKKHQVVDDIVVLIGDSSWSLESSRSSDDFVSSLGPSEVVGVLLTVPSRSASSTVHFLVSSTVSSMFSAAFSYCRISTLLYNYHPLHMADCHGRLTGIVICEELSSSILSSSFNASAVAPLADIYPNLK